MRKKTKEFQYKWVILGICFLMVFVTLGFCSSNKGLFLAAISEALDIKRSLFSLNDSFRYIVSSLLNVMFGMLIARFGPRKLITAGFCCIVSALWIYSVAETVADTRALCSIYHIPHLRLATMTMH